MAVIPARHVADNLAVAHDRLIVIDERLGIGQAELHHARGEPLLLPAQDRIAADEIRLGEIDGKAETGFQHVILLRDVMAEMPERLLDAAGIHHVHAAQFQIEIAPGFADGLVDMRRHVGRNVDLPAKFADIGDAVCAGERHADLDLTGLSERMVRIRPVMR